MKAIQNFWSWLFGIIAVLSIALVCMMIAINPNAIANIFGYNLAQTQIAKLPYYVDFQEKLGKQSGYRSQYIIHENTYWYMNYGNTGGGIDDFVRIGWTANNKPNYPNYMVKDKDISIKDIDLYKNHYSYMIMDFDFNNSHSLTFDFEMYDVIPRLSGESYIYIIASRDKGNTWSVEKTYEDDMFSDRQRLTFEYKYNQSLINVTTIRYGIVISSDLSNYSVRLKPLQFYAQRLG